MLSISCVHSKILTGDGGYIKLPIVDDTTATQVVITVIGVVVLRMSVLITALIDVLISALIIAIVIRCATKLWDWCMRVIVTQ